MRRSEQLSKLSIALAVVLSTACAHAPRALAPAQIPFDQGWQIQSSAQTAAGGEAISGPSFDASGWIPTTVPSTVFAALARNGNVPDPFAGKNLETLPKEPYGVAWWYRKEFPLAAVPRHAQLTLDGVNYSAEVWLNGAKVAGPDTLFGSFRVFELDVTPQLRTGSNVLAVKVYPPKRGDPTIGFVDWNPTAPDNNLGLWRGVMLKITGGVSMDDVWVRGDVDPKNLDEGRISVSAQVANHSVSPVTAILRGRIGPGQPIAFERSVRLAGGESQSLVIGPEDFPQLVVKSPRLWWPNNLGEPNLYALQLETVVDGNVSDSYATSFGIRHIADYINEQGHRGYAINGERVQLRGGGWVDDVLLVEDPQKLEDQIRYVRHMNLNMIRLEGFWGNTHLLYDLADRYGIMIWAGWSCQWEWEDYLGQPVEGEKYMGIDTPDEIALITQSLRDQVVRIRNHPSVIVWNLGSDKLPVPELERRSAATLAEVDPTRPPLMSCKSWTSDVSGPTAVKMAGPYEWVPPNYWFDPAAPGGAFGFNTETGPGAQPPVAESIRRMLPKESWWPIDDMWAYHAARNEFKNLDRYVAALDARYGPSKDLDEFAMKSQIANYEAMRGMMEAFSLRRPVATGIVQWMLNAAWPKMFWQFYDYYLVPTGAFYAARDSGRPIHIAYDHGTKKIVALNDTKQPLKAVARVRVFDAASKVLYDMRTPIDVPAGQRSELPAIPDGATGGFHFLDTRIESADGALIDANFYWLPARADVLAWDKGEWFYTPVSEFADLKVLNDLPRAELDVKHTFTPGPAGTAVDVTLRNPGPNIAFFVELSVAGKNSGSLAAPVFWDTNYVSLAPGETRTVHATFPAHALKEEPLLRYRGINAGGSAQ